MSLNSKKSWHPSKAINQAKVTKREQDDAKEQLLHESERRELAAQQNLIDLRQQVTVKSNKDAEGSKVPWMYADAPRVVPATKFTDEKETYPKPIDINGPASPISHSPTDLSDKGSRLIDPRKLELINAADPFAQILRNKKPKSRTDDRVTKSKRKGQV